MARFCAYVLVVLAALPFIVAVDPTSSVVDGIRSGQHALANDGHFFVSIKSQLPKVNWCLDVLAKDAVLSECDAGATSQLWYLNGSSIVNYNGQCLDGCTKRCQYPVPQRNAFIADCNGNPAQQWATDGDSIVNVAHKTCLDVCHAQGYCKPNPDATTFECHEDTNQAWELILGGYVAPSLPVTREDPKP